MSSWFRARWWEIGDCGKLIKNLILECLNFLRNLNFISHQWNSFQINPTFWLCSHNNGQPTAVTIVKVTWNHFFLFFVFLSERNECEWKKRRKKGSKSDILQDHIAACDWLENEKWRKEKKSREKVKNWKKKTVNVRVIKNSLFAFVVPYFNVHHIEFTFWSCSSLGRISYSSSRPRIILS